MFNYFKTSVVAFALMNTVILADQPYDSVHSLPHTPYYVLDGYVFYSLISSNDAAVVIDVESHDGGVARYIAQQASSLPFLQEVYSVNMWESFDPSQENLYQQFLSNVKHEETDNWIIPLRMSSLEAAGALNVLADFICIGAHDDEDEICHEILAWFSHLSDTGVICGNTWKDHSVQMGVTEAASILDVDLQVSGNIWYIQKSFP